MANLEFSRRWLSWRCECEVLLSEFLSWEGLLTSLHVAGYCHLFWYQRCAEILCQEPGFRNPSVRPLALYVGATHHPENASKDLRAGHTGDKTYAVDVVLKLNTSAV